MQLTRADFDLLFNALMDRPPEPAEAEALFAKSKGIAYEAVCLIGQYPDFVRQHPSFIPKPLNEALSEATVNGVPVLVTTNDWVHSGTARGSYEPWVAAVLREILKPGGVFLDVGANIGVHSVLGAHLVGPTGCVYSVEASIDVAAALLANARHTGLGNIVVAPVAVTDKAHVEQIMVGHGTSNRFVRPEAVDLHKFNFEPVLCNTLDSLVGHVDRLDLIKIDIEGREGSALRGAAKLLDRFRPPIIAEHHFAAAENWFVDDLLARGYDMAVLLHTGERKPLGNDRAALAKLAGEFVYVDLLFRHHTAA